MLIFHRTCCKSDNLVLHHQRWFTTKSVDFLVLSNTNQKMETEKYTYKTKCKNGSSAFTKATTIRKQPFNKKAILRY